MHFAQFIREQPIQHEIGTYTVAGSYLQCLYGLVATQQSLPGGEVIQVPAMGSAATRALCPRIGLSMGRRADNTECPWPAIHCR